MSTNAEKITTDTALAFAQALVEGRWDAAFQALSPDLQGQNSPEQIKKQFTDLTSYGTGPVRVEKETTFMDTWPDQAAQDLGWIYVPFGADGLSEAVTVVVSGPEQAPRIRSVAWGRP